MNPWWKNRLIAAVSALLAVVVGWKIAEGSYALALVAGAVASGAGLVMLSRLPLDAITVGGLLVGYIVGNRGFAQISLLPGLPLLPAEAGLMICLICLATRAAFAKTLPLRRDALNVTVALWIVVGSARIVPDVRAYGAFALRDFAAVYYALFFFVAQALAKTARTRVFFDGCLRWATVVIIPISQLFSRFPDFFFRTLAVGGIPLIFFKGDLVATFMAIGVLFTHRRWEATRHVAWLAFAVLGVVGVIASENRASLVGLAVATAWLASGRQWGLLRLQLAGAAAAVLILLAGIALGIVSARDNAGARLYERIASMVDVTGTRAYDSSEVEFKGDNNRFRLIWWQAVAEETIDKAPWFGLGFGYDLAATFLQRYYPTSDEDFSTRSPHSILLSVFGRMGGVGLVSFIAIAAVMARRTWQTLRPNASDGDAPTAWLATWVILTSACFGVVLEGPMGAVVFWTVLGIANATSADLAARTEEEVSPGAAVADLRNTAPAIQVTAAP
jgi:O-antigen ligase